MSSVLKVTQGDYVVYPTHGVGRVVTIETQDIAGQELKMFVIAFDNERMNLRLPIAKAQKAGLRALSSTIVMEKALKTLQGRAKTKRKTWAQRAQEYDEKINSGDPVAIAEVIRDLHRTKDHAEQSYSERQIYQAAVLRLTQELAVIEKIAPEQATQRLREALLKEAA